MNSFIAISQLRPAYRTPVVLLPSSFSKTLSAKLLLRLYVSWCPQVLLLTSKIWIVCLPLIVSQFGRTATQRKSKKLFKSCSVLITPTVMFTIFQIEVPFYVMRCEHSYISIRLLFMLDSTSTLLIVVELDCR